MSNAFVIRVTLDTSDTSPQGWGMPFPSNAHQRDDQDNMATTLNSILDRGYNNDLSLETIKVELKSYVLGHQNFADRAFGHIDEAIEGINNRMDELEEDLNAYSLTAARG